jgi:MtN3 and saliva related transmembrane protein
VTFTIILGLAAALCTTLSFVPQVVKAWRTRKTDDISLGTSLSLIVGLALWLVYGVILKDLPLILANFVTLCLASSLLVFKLRFG